MSTILFPRQRQEDAVRVRLESVRARNATKLLLPEDVVDDARDPASPYHDRFDWDDTSAAHKYRLVTARTLIRSVQVNVKTEHSVVSTVAYLHDPALDPQIPGYRPVAELRTTRDVAKSALRREIEAAISAMRRARDVAASLDLEAEAETLLAQLTTMAEHIRDVA